MPHLAVFERIRLVDLYNYLQTHTENKFKVLSMMVEAKYGIRISAKRADNKVLIIKLHQHFHKMHKKVTVNEN